MLEARDTLVAFGEEASVLQAQLARSDSHRDVEQAVSQIQVVSRKLSDFAVIHGDVDLLEDRINTGLIDLTQQVARMEEDAHRHVVAQGLDSQDLDGMSIQSTPQYGHHQAFEEQFLSPLSQPNTPKQAEVADLASPGLKNRGPGTAGGRPISAHAGSTPTAAVTEHLAGSYSSNSPTRKGRQRPHTALSRTRPSGIRNSPGHGKSKPERSMGDLPELATRVHNDYQNLDSPHAYQEMPLHMQASLQESPGMRASLPAADKRSPLQMRRSNVYLSIPTHVNPLESPRHNASATVGI